MRRGARLRARILARARATDPETSHAAAASITEESLRKTQSDVLTILREHGPLCDDELADHYKRLHGVVSYSGCRTRRGELVRLGFVEDTGDRVQLDSGRWSIVWRAIT